MTINNDDIKRMVLRRPIPDKLIRHLRDAPLVDGGAVVDEHSHLVDRDLSPSELLVTRLASHGLNDIEVADVLSLSVYTIKGQMKGAMRKTRSKNRTHLVANALRTGLIN
jgi:DNA-binding CsgD family transcriptional regulator